jgi:hypothetical protein
MIIFTHHSGEPHGILGAQVAATFIQQKLSIPTIVVGIERDFLKEQLLRFIDESYAPCIVPWRLDTADRIEDRHHVQQGRNLDSMVGSVLQRN